MICEGCQAHPAEFTLSMVDSQSPANLSYACVDCTYAVLDAWVVGRDDTDDTEGWEVRRIKETT